MLRWLTAGESHGPELLAVLEGLPAGVPVSLDDIRADLVRRRLGYGRGARMSFEQDELTISSGIRHGATMGSPIALRVGNTEWPRWIDVMSAQPRDPETLPKGRGAPLIRPRPGHADLVGMQKYAFPEARNVLERASARETTARVSLGAIARRFLGELGITLVSHTLSIGPVRVPEGSALPTPDDVDALDADPLRCYHPETSALMVAEVDRAHEDGETLGGVVEVLAYGLPPGLGSYVHWDRRLDAQLAAAVMGIQAIKGVEIGDGFLTTTRRGSEAHDEIFPGADGIARASDRAGGTEGGMSTGTVLRVRAGMKPISTVPHALRTVDVTTGEATQAQHQRSDVCAVPASGVVAEAMVALVLANAVLEKFGGDSVTETRRNLNSYLAAIPPELRTSATSDPALGLA
ncbi:chorismate synthase [Rathayibacter toxicus]|uniref:Chorismate synthase n=1 Tax=Rathayibacter toxicus TaxID=145458 RepID=A0A0C5BHP4_9MICO|nr:chorismate synthase [Rathayibacter toxicus]AJM77790.1 chorismate synthase [Rathayibacter toxicus]ALS58035.1 chorismate synthase [Rathayibacter toxicus]KKM44260.1 chorismate synthase [Rathayibacter toxicus]PPG20277.1 chorismate synthase [Rathayibacter toxicus]PPG45376.1 chorismate synthase [Rathayibacter toxicus]